MKSLEYLWLYFSLSFTILKYHTVPHHSEEIAKLTKVCRYNKILPKNRENNADFTNEITEDVIWRNILSEINCVILFLSLRPQKREIVSHRNFFSWTQLSV